MSENMIIDGGLDLAHAAPAIPPGRIRDCLNYEVGYRRGMSRIDGFERFDGKISPSNTTGWVFEVDKLNVTGILQVPESLSWGERETNSAEVVAIEDNGITWRLFFVFRTGRKHPELGDTITGDVSGASFLADDIITSTLKTLPEYFADHQSYLAALDGFATTLRGEVAPVPGGGTIVGLHYHEDQLYAIRDVLEVTVPEADAGLLIPGMYVYNDAGQVGLILTSGVTKVNITAADADGFTLSAGESFHAALTIRFVGGGGEFNKNDAVTTDILPWVGTVGHIARRDGSFDAQTALGVAAFIKGPDGGPANNEVFTNTTVTGTMKMSATLFPTLRDIATVESVSSTSDVASMWRSTDAGWEHADTGSLLAFIDGTNDPLDMENAVPVQLVGTAGVVSQGSGGKGWQNPLDNIMVVDTNEIYASLHGGLYAGHSDYTSPVEARKFKIGALDNDTILGATFKFTWRQPSTDAGTSILNAKVQNSDTVDGGFFAPVTVYQQVPRAGAGVYATTEVPGTGPLLWGLPSTAAEVNKETYGVRFSVSTNPVNAAVSVHIDAVTMTLYVERLPGQELYLWNGLVDVGTIQVESIQVQEGDWITTPAAPAPDPRAEGYFRLKDWSVTDISAGTEIWTGPGATGLYVGKTTGGVTIPSLPGSNLLDAENSRYQMISYNFYATEEQNAIYGVSGAGPAFWYDGSTLDFISTGLEASQEKPRHLSPHQNRLVLGYIWGEAYVSDVNSPLTYNGADFAASYGFGDKITGLMPISGDALAVFTESATHVLYGNYGADTPPDQKVINHKVGAIEYTVQSMGNRPIFASFRGIETLETMDQYSDFFTAPLTYDVSPWLLERLQTAAGVEATDKSVVNSVVVRDKNQYRLFFADGYLLTLSHVGPEKDPQNTIQQYWFESDRTKFSRCFATASGVTTNGKARAFFSTELRPTVVTPTSRAITGEELDYVYELDKGRSFDGGAIDAHFSLTYYFGQGEQGGPNPQRAKRDNAFHLHGTCAGTADLRMSRSANYEELDDPTLPYEPVPFWHGSKKAEDTQKPKYTKGRLTARGFAISVQIAHTSRIEFPHTIQMISFLDDVPLRQDR